MITDIHTHGIGGYDTRSSDVEHILKIADIQGSYGVDEIILTVYPSTIKVMRENISLIKQAMGLQQSGDTKLRPEFPVSKYGPAEGHGPARIAGVHLEGPFLNPAMCGSLNAMVLIEPAERNFDQLIDGFEDIIRIITIAPELEGASCVIKKASGLGILLSMGHSNASFAETEAGHKAGAKGITHLFNAMRPYHHREPGIAGYGLLNQDIYVEVIADPFHLHPLTLELIFRVKNPERIIIVSDSIRETMQSPDATREVRSLTDNHSRLLGGALPITGAAAALSGIFGDQIATNCISVNPCRYLAK
jgi:N-acetylglucosamine-6-phosphate deacetylase